MKRRVFESPHVTLRVSSKLVIVILAISAKVIVRRSWLSPSTSAIPVVSIIETIASVLCAIVGVLGLSVLA